MLFGGCLTIELGVRKCRINIFVDDDKLKEDVENILYKICFTLLDVADYCNKEINGF